MIFLVRAFYAILCGTFLFTIGWLFFTELCEAGVIGPHVTYLQAGILAGLGVGGGAFGLWMTKYL